jgi:hypothetical protein
MLKNVFYPIIKLVSLATMACILTACVSTSFLGYPQVAAGYKRSLAQSSAAIDASLAELDEQFEDADRLLYLMESGRLAQLNSEFERSQQSFSRAIADFEQQDLQAKVSIGRSVRDGVSLITNDTAIPYSGAGYERLAIHHYQALNYWAQNDLEGAAVEFRKLALEQRILAEAHEKEIAEAHSEAAKESVDLSSIDNEFNGLDTLAGPLKSSFQNAYSFYTSGSFWEAQGDLNAALVDYKKALEINPSSKMLKQDIRRVTGSDKRSANNSPKAGQGTLVVLFEEGFVQSKEAFNLSVPTANDGWLQISMPFYSASGVPPSVSLSLYQSQKLLGKTESLASYNALAAKDLKEQLPSLLLRQTLRAYTKYELQKQTGKQLGDLGQLAVNIVNFVTERADLRSWSTLPMTGQAQRFNLTPGRQTVTMKAHGVKLDTVLDIKAGKTQYLRVVYVGGKLIPQSFVL